MWITGIIATALVTAVLVWWLWPLHRAKADTLPVLLFGKIGTPLCGSKDKHQWIDEKTLRNLFIRLQRDGYHALTPSRLHSTLPIRPVMLVFVGGYASFYTCVFPLLEKYNLCASISMPAEYIGQYDAWQTPAEGPWQNLLSETQLRTLLKSGRVELISQSLDGQLPPQPQQAAWQLDENAHRLKIRCAAEVHAAYWPQPNPTVHPVSVSLLISAQCGNNRLPLSADPLRVFWVTHRTFLTRLFWRMARR